MEPPLHAVAHLSNLLVEVVLRRADGLAHDVVDALARRDAVAPPLHPLHLDARRVDARHPAAVHPRARLALLARELLEDAARRREPGPLPLERAARLPAALERRGAQPEPHAQRADEEEERLEEEEGRRDARRVLQLVDAPHLVHLERDGRALHLGLEGRAHHRDEQVEHHDDHQERVHGVERRAGAGRVRARARVDVQVQVVGRRQAVHPHKRPHEARANEVDHRRRLGRARPRELARAATPAAAGSIASTAPSSVSATEGGEGGLVRALDVRVEDGHGDAGREQQRGRDDQEVEDVAADREHVREDGLHLVDGLPLAEEREGAHAAEEEADRQPDALRRVAHVGHVEGRRRVADADHEGDGEAEQPRDVEAVLEADVRARAAARYLEARLRRLVQEGRGE